MLSFAAESGEKNASSEAIVSPVTELEMLVGLPSQAKLLRESDENPAAARNLFEQPEVRDYLLGESPRFVYIPEAPDPMIIPWVRAEIVADELLADAQATFARAKESKNWDLLVLAMDQAKKITKNYPDSKQAEDANEIIRQGDSLVSIPEDFDGKIPCSISPTPSSRLPGWITSNTTGMIFDLGNAEESVVLVDDSLIHPGESIKYFPTVTLKEVKPQTAVFEYLEREFSVHVSGQ